MSIRRRLGRIANHVHQYRHWRSARFSEPRDALATLIASEVVGFVDDLYAEGIDTPIGKLYAHHLGDYMRRYLLAHPYGTVRLHGIQQPDQDPDLHDHPWDAVCLILRGGYTEERPMPGTKPEEMKLQRQHFGPGSVNFLRATDAHRIVELDGPTWTLVFTGQRIRQWGFYTPCGWMAWDVYPRGTKTDPDQYAARLAEVGVTE